MRHAVLIVISDQDFLNPDVKQAIKSLPDESIGFRSLALALSSGKAEACKKVYTLEKNVETLQKLYSGSEVKVLALNIPKKEKSFSELTKEDLEAMKKGELDALCQDNKDILSEVKYSTLKKDELITQILEVIKG